jgi:hypothetical protein
MATYHKILFLFIIIVAQLLVTETKRIYVKPHPATEAKRSTEIVSQIGRVHKAFPEVNGFVLEVLFKTDQAAPNLFRATQTSDPNFY